MMDKNTSIEVSHISKKFCKSLPFIIKYGLLDIGKSVFGFKGNAYKLRHHEFWAINNLSFKLKRGESLGIIGANGSGKSTLLKLLNGIFLPDKGIIKVKGKLGALIEVGAGFHPLLTGRENIYIFGTILGMSQKEIDKKFTEIVKFANIGDFLEAPVKTYSNGMYVRLSFSITIHSLPDVLLIDEILAAGDLKFQKKCHQKMKEIYKRGKTIVFVSHDLTAISSLCKRVIWLDKGEIKLDDSREKVIPAYKKSQQKE